jgi:hypothetical protein
MNILEAIEAVKSGMCIRYQSKGKCPYYIIQTTLVPVGLKALKQIDADDARREDTYPESLSDLCLDDLERICVDAIFYESFAAISFEAMLTEIQESWKKFNEEEDE